MYVFISVLIVIAALLLVFVVVIQNSKGGGLAAGFSSSNQVMGVRKTTDFLEKATWGLAGILVLLCLISSPRSTDNGVRQSELKDDIQNAVPVNPNATPFGNPPATKESTPTPEASQTTPASEGDASAK